MGAAGTTRRNQGSSSTATFEDWDFWWAHNAQPFLNLKASLFQQPSESESADFFFGRKSKAATKDTSRPTKRFVASYLVPRIKKVFGAKNPDIRDSACVALGRTGGAPDISNLLEALKDKTANVRGAAVLGLGLLQCEEAIEPLLHILHADSDGAKLRGGREPEWKMRAMATAALALSGDNDKNEVKDTLKKYSVETSLNQEIRVTATVGLGLLKSTDKNYCEDVLCPPQEHRVETQQPRLRAGARGGVSCPCDRTQWSSGRHRDREVSCPTGPSRPREARAAQRP